jgi:hypothetical protein
MFYQKSTLTDSQILAGKDAFFIEGFSTARGKGTTRFSLVTSLKARLLHNEGKMNVLYGFDYYQRHHGHTQSIPENDFRRSIGEMLNAY